jgi:hypothetical protein
MQVIFGDTRIDRYSTIGIPFPKDILAKVHQRTADRTVGVICVAFTCTMSVTISMAACVVMLLVINATRSPRVQEKPLVTVSNMPFELIDEPNMRQENRV